MDYNLLIDHIQIIMRYETFQWFYAALFSVVVLASMIINNLTRRKWLSLIFLTVIGTLFFMFSLYLVDVTVPRADLDYYSAATICLFSVTLILSYTTARFGIVLTTSPRKRLAGVLARILTVMGNTTTSASFSMYKTADRLAKFSTHSHTLRVENLVEKAEQLKERMAE